MKHALSLFLLTIPLFGAEVRVAVVAAPASAMARAADRFAQQHGADRIEVRVLDDEREAGALQGAHLVYLNFARNDVMPKLAPHLRAARQAGAILAAAPWDSAERHIPGMFDRTLSEAAGRYWTEGGLENLAGFLAWAYRTSGGKRPIAVPDPVRQPAAGLYHPRAERLFPTRAEFESWYQPGERPRVALTFYASVVRLLDTAAVDRIIAELEQRGLAVYPVFGWPVHEAAALLPENPRALLGMNITLQKSEDAALFARLDVPVFTLHTTRETAGQWKSGNQGLPPDRVATGFNQPERAGAIEPILVAATEDGRIVPLPEQIAWLGARVSAWLRLQAKENSAKRVAIVYYNYPPGQWNIGASYLQVFPSLHRILNAMQQAGYETAGPPPPERELQTRLLACGRNLEEWEKRSLNQLARRPDVALLPLEQYERWFEQLPAALREAVVQRWGRAGDSPLMVTRCGEGRCFVLPGWRRGNIFLMPQPLRTTFAEAAVLTHDPVTPPPHSYLAAYLWLQHEFDADAVVHLGRHGTVEWLPGKQTALAAEDAPAALLGALPNIYPYIMDGGGEAMQAKRRGNAVMVSHRTPELQDAGEPLRYERLHDISHQMEAAAGASPALLNEYESLLRFELKRLQLDRQLELTADLPRDELEKRVHSFLHDVEGNTVPGALPVFGGDEREIAGLLEALDGRHLVSGPLGDPRRVPQAMPPGRNLHAVDPALLPTPAACRLGEKMAADFLAQKKQVPQQVSFVLWYGETERNQGAMECMALALAGVAPIWNSRGQADSLRLIPDAELKRPRVNAVFTTSGNYRDGFPHLIVMLDRAMRLAAAAGDNAIRRQDREVEAALRQAGVAPDLAQQLARARVFSAAPGSYGTGTNLIIEQSLDAKKPGIVAQQFLRHLNHAYGDGFWGVSAPQAFARHLKGNTAVFLSRTSHLYGALDNDDVYQYAGGLNLASKSVNGAAPKVFLQNLRQAGQARSTDLRTFLVAEMSARHWNPQWIKAMKDSGYAGARQIAREMEHLYGFQATAGEHLDPSVWQTMFNVYVKDQYRLGVNEFLAAQNPHAQQALYARLLEVDRQGKYRFTENERRALRDALLVSFRRDGVAGSANVAALAGSVQQTSLAVAAAPSLPPGGKWFSLRGLKLIPRDRFDFSAPSIMARVDELLGFLGMWLGASLLVGPVLVRARRQT